MPTPNPTQRVRKPLYLGHLAEEVDNYRFDNEIPTCVEALRQIIVAGLAEVRRGTD